LGHAWVIAASVGPLVGRW